MEFITKKWKKFKLGPFIHHPIPEIEAYENQTEWVECTLVDRDITRVDVENALIDLENQLDDKFLMSISEDTIDQVAEFSYNKKDAGNNVRVIPQNGYSIKNLLDGDLTNNNGKAIAEIDDVYLEDGKASHLIVDFEDVYFDETVAVEYEIAEIVTHEDDYNFQLLSPREVQLENFRQTRLN